MILRNLVDASFLLLAVIMITVVLKDNRQNVLTDAARNDTLIVKQTLEKTISNNIGYLEGRVNKLGETQDTYQVSTTHRINLLERKVEKLEKDNKNTNRIINTITNNNTNIVNGKVADEAKNNNK